MSKETIPGAPLESELGASMPNYTVKLADETKLESVMADDFNIDPEGELTFLSRDNNNVATRVAVFARGQWQFVRR